MARNLLIFAVAVLVFWFGADLLTGQQADNAGRDTAARSPSSELESIVPPSGNSGARRYADISVHTTEQLELLFDRVEALLDRPRSEGEAPIISLVLHGPEVEFFALKNYPRYKNLVDRAARLAAFGAIDISICQTQMRRRGIGKDEVPSFLRQVPFGPAEVERLRKQGYIAM
ncbi:hypothetical protein DFR30_2822 [Thiogranum longum]|uniref:Uncharacterized protein n=1 Tax=Thiogranum longum TaxID=1537524 RepID=A0A4R1HJ32_9GAMM|nr:DsrE family protein [Thiogranum longum]TCK19509.1 hypothetical protein DFR30_2822 [Thiogranum longum]